MFTFKSAFLVSIGFSIGYYKGVQHGSRFKELVEEIKHDPEVREMFEALKDAINNPERPEDVEGKDVSTDPSLPATSKNPARGTTLDIERIAEINAATPENPVILTSDEVKAMKLSHVQVNLGCNRFKIRAADGTVYDRMRVELAREMGDDLPEPIDAIEKATEDISTSGDKLEPQPPSVASMAKSEPDPDNPDRPII